MRILVTGANGFVGRRLVPSLLERGCAVRGTVRISQMPAAAEARFNGAEIVPAEDIGPNTNWDSALNGIDAVIHLAGRAHVLHDTAIDPLSEFRKVNVQGTERLARLAATRGIKRFVFISSIGVNGDVTTSEPFRESDPTNPHDPYSASKWEAEQMLNGIASGTNLEVVIVRPPLVYGPAVPGNFLRLLNWTYKAIPLPLSGAEGRKSLVGVDNLADFLAVTAIAPQAANQTFIISDGEDISTADLIRRLARFMNRPIRIYRAPEKLLSFVARLTRNPKTIRRLFGSLVVDPGKAFGLLGWRPPVTLNEGLLRTATWYMERHAGTVSK